MLLVDGLNTSIGAQQQVHRQMVKMLKTIPENVPVSVFLPDRQLHLLQNFTTDPTLLKTAAAKAFSLDAAGLADVDPSEDPEALSAQLVDVPNAPLEVLARFERETFVDLPYVAGEQRQRREVGGVTIVVRGQTGRDLS